MPGNAGDHAARAKKAKATEAEGSAAAAALKVVKAQARADAAAEKKVADAALKVATEAGQGGCRCQESLCRIRISYDADRTTIERSDQLKPYAGNLGEECGDGQYDEDITIKRIGRRRRPRGCFSAGQFRLREYKKLPPLRNRLPLRYDKKSQAPPQPRLQCRFQANMLRRRKNNDRARCNSKGFCRVHKG